MPAFCIIQNDNTRETFMWIGRDAKEGNWFPSGPDEFQGVERFLEVLENHEDPEQLLFEIGSIWNERKKKKDVDGEADF